MHLGNAHDYAKLLVDLHGDKAELQAARKARALEQDGQNENLELWRRIRTAIREMRGPHES
ncbi:hypothetical protein MnTg02_02031 [bacterium MnTg02]|nr:hypothetical protein MnTg02_02031 [bacterium MnTg02]